MPFTGSIVWPTGSSTRLPNNGFLLIGEDNNHYCAMYRQSLPSSTHTLQIGQCESNAITSYRTRAQVLADVATFPGVTGTYKPQDVIPIIGTQYVGVLCSGQSGQPNNDHVICPIYKINSSGVLEFTSSTGFFYDGPSYNISPAGDTGQVYGVVVNTDEEEVYFVFNSSGDILMGHAPYTGTNIDLTNGSWDLRCTVLPFGAPFLVPYAAGSPGQRCGLIDRGSGVIGLLKYVSQAHINTNNDPGTPGFFTSPIIDPLTDPQMFYVEANTVAQTATALENVSSLFGAPFSDSLKKFDGSAGVVGQDDYFDASICGDEVVLPRNYTDNVDCLGIRRWNFPDALTVENLGLSQQEGFTITSVNSGLAGGSAYRDGASDTLQLMLRDASVFYFLEADLPLAEEVPPTVIYPPTTTIDTVEELPPADAIIETQRWLLRTGHIRQWGEIACDDLRVTVRRGVGDTDTEPQLWVRALRDNRTWTKWARKGLGKKGDRIMTIYFGGFGTAKDWQFEFASTDDCEIELRKAEIMPTQLGH